MSRPILAVDVDGVISIFGFDDPPGRDEARFELVDGMVHCISLLGRRPPAAPVGALRHGLGDGVGGRANDYLPNILGLPVLPHLTFNGTARFGSAHWKLGPLDEYCQGRPMAWIDDNLDESCYEWARARPEPTLLVPTEPHLGLEEAETEALVAWARGL